MRRDTQFDPFRIEWGWIGFALFIALMLWAEFGDLWRLVFG
jgi:hypothetical protein